MTIVVINDEGHAGDIDNDDDHILIQILIRMTIVFYNSMIMVYLLRIKLWWRLCTLYTHTPGDCFYFEEFPLSMGSSGVCCGGGVMTSKL